MKFFLGIGLGLALSDANPDGVVLLAWLLMAIMVPLTIAMGWGAWRLRKTRLAQSKTLTHDQKQKHRSPTTYL